MSNNPTTEVTVPGAAKQRTLIHTDEEADAICSWAASKPGLRREVGPVLLSTLRYSGQRLAELTSLRLDDLDTEANRLSVIGKGDQPRTVPIPPVLSPILGRYVAETRPKLTASPFVFVNPKSRRGSPFSGRYGRAR